MKHNSPVSFKLIKSLLWIKGPRQSPNCKAFKCPDKNLSNSSCHFPYHKLVFLRISHHFSVSWDINSLCFFSWNCICFQQKEPIKVQIWWNITWAVKSQKFCTLMGSFCSHHIYKVSAKKVQKSYLWRVMLSLKKDFGFKYDITNLKNFYPTTQKSKPLKILLRWSLFVQSIWGLS